MKTVYLINSLEGGGAERVFSQLLELISADELASIAAIDVILLDIKAELYPLPESVTVHRVGRSGSILWPCIQFFAVFVLLTRLKPKRVVSFLTRANIFNAIFGMVLRFQSVISERSNTAGRISGRLSAFKRALVGFVYARADKIIAVSDGVANCLIEEFYISPNKISVLNNPVDTDAIQRSASKDNWQSNEKIKPRMVAMGRLVETKGFVDLIHAYAESQQTCGLMILGDGPKRQELQELINNLGLDSQIFLIGFVDNPYAIIQQADIFILSSQLEGFPNALVESMSLGKAVIATDCNDGPREILSLNKSILNGEVVQTEFGLMVNVGERAAMAKAMTRLLEDDDLIQQLSNKAIERVARYSKQEFYKNYKDIVEYIDTNQAQATDVKGKVL